MRRTHVDIPNTVSGLLSDGVRVNRIRTSPPWSPVTVKNERITPTTKTIKVRSISTFGVSKMKKRLAHDRVAPVTGTCAPSSTAVTSTWK